MTTKAQVQAIYNDIDAALAEIAKKHGLDKLKLGNCSFSNDGFTSKLEGIFSGGESKEMQKLRLHAFSYGLKEDVCNATIKYSNAEYKVIGLRSKNMLIERDGRIYTAPAEQVVRSIKFYNRELCLE